MAKKYFRKGMALFLSLTMCLSLLNLSVLAATSSSAQQIVNAGGSATSADGKVTVSKTIEGTPFENYFDITLAVETGVDSSKVLKHLDTDVVIVMDISNTMNSALNSDAVVSSPNRRYDYAVSAAKSFINNLKNKTADFPEDVTVRVGLVAFDTNAHNIMGLTAPSSVVMSGSNSIFKKTDTIINTHLSQSQAKVDPGTRYTNIEGGLKMAQNMLNGSSAANKKVVFISDGFPTTWVKSGTDGYNPRTETSVFGKDWRGLPVDAGTSYSETGARRAASQASSMHNAGIEIYPVGVGALNTQTILKHLQHGASGTHSGCNSPAYCGTDSHWKGGSLSVVETGANFNGNWSFNPTSSSGFENWLQNTIGNCGNYWRANGSVDGLNTAFNAVLTDIEDTASEVLASWVATDPMSAVSPSAVDFIGFFDKNGRFTGNDELQGSFTEGGEDTASISTRNGIEAITWNLLLSGYEYDTESKTYTYSLKYRVRLANEMAGFIEDDSNEETLADVYDTNGVTTLQYVDEVTVNGQTTSSVEKNIDFPIPSVKGHLGELSFTKMDGDNGVALAGAKFTLTHSGENCAVCEGADYHVNVPAQMQVSDENGVVRFSGIPSGHSYLLTETEAPVGYWSGGNDNTWNVVVDYDSTSIRNANGSASNPEIHNYLIPPEYVEWTPEALKTTEEFDLEAGDFTFVLKNEAGDVISTATNDADGNVRFPTHYFTQPGTYVYYMSEVAGDNDDIIYDSSVYKYTVTVTLESDIIVIPQPVNPAPAGENDYSQSNDTTPVDNTDNGDVPTGDNGDVPADDNGDAPAGDNGAVPADGNGDAPAGDNGDVPADDNGDVPSGDNGDVPAGDNGDAPADNNGDGQSDDNGGAPSDDNGDVPAGDNGDSQSGDNGDVPAGDNGDVPADNNGDASVGDNNGDASVGDDNGDASVGDNNGDAPAGDNPQPTVQSSLSRALRSIGSVIKMSLVDLSDPTDSDVPSDDNNDVPSEDNSDVPSGDNGDVPAGDNGDVPAGDNGNAPTGDNGDVPAGDNGDVPSGDNGDVPSGDNGDVLSGDNSDVPAGDNGDVPSGDNGDVPSGDNGDVPSGDNGDVPAGDNGNAPAGDNGDSYSQSDDTNVDDSYNQSDDTNVNDNAYDQKEDTVLVDGMEVPKADIPQRPVDAPDAVTWLEISLSVEKDGAAESSPVAQFTNKLAPPPPPPGSNPPPPSGPVYVSRFVNKVWNDNGDLYGLRPDSITVNLMVNGMVYESVELSASNGWSFVWSGLDAEQDWTVEEAEVPEGYVSTVSSSGNRYTITNSLPSEELPPPEEELPPPEEGGNNGGDGELEELPEEEVPLADIPVTGDPMTLYAISAALSGLGLAWLGLKKKEEDEV